MESRRTTLKKMAGAFALGVSGLSLETMRAEAQSPKKGGTLTYAMSAETPHYDGHGSDTFATIQFSAPFYSTLLKFDLDKYPNVTGDLAQSYTVSPDKLTYTFKLHPNVKFHDGTPCTSADVKATYDRLRNPPQGVVSTRKATFADIASIETPDPLTVVFKLKEVNAAILQHFGSPWNFIYSAKDLEKDPNWPKTHINGTGAFTFVEHVKGSHVAGKTQRELFQKGPALSRRLQRRVLPAGGDHAQRVAGWTGAGRIPQHFRARETTAHSNNGRQHPHSGVKLDAQSSGLLQRRKEALRRCARAPRVGHGYRPLGRQQGPGQISTLRSVGGVLRPGYPLATPEAELVKLPGFSKDIAKSRAEAKKILADAGLKDLKFTLHNRSIAQPYTPAGVFLVDQWRQIGVTVENKQQETAPYLAGLNSGNYDVAIDFSNLFMDDPSLALSKYLSIDRSPDNRSRSKDPELDKLYDAQMRELDPKKRQALVQAFEKRAVRTGLSATVALVVPHGADPQDRDGLAHVAKP